MDGLRLHDWAAAGREFLAGMRLRHGAVLLRGFAADGMAGFSRFQQAAMGSPIPYLERTSPRRQLEAGIHTSTEYPASEPIPLHNENSYASAWPLELAFFCEIPPATAGATPIADVRHVVEAIPQPVLETFRQKGVLYVRNFHEEIGVSWRDAFGAATREEAEEFCRLRGYECSWSPAGVFCTAWRAPAFARHPLSGERLWFNHAAFFHSRSLPEPVRRALRSQFAEDELPMACFYGDGSPIEDATVEVLLDAYHQAARAFPWREGDLLLLDNMLVAHGREPFTGARSILVAMSHAVTRDMANASGL